MISLLVAAFLLAATPEPKERYMVEYVTVEPCYECGNTYAVYCETPGCATPSKEVTHVSKFDSKESAIDFMNSGMAQPKPAPETTYFGNPLGLSPKKPYPVKFKALYRLAEIPVLAVEKQLEVQREPERFTVTAYRLAQ